MERTEQKQDFRKSKMIRIIFPILEKCRQVLQGLMANDTILI